MRRSITELNEKEFYSEFFNIFPFLNEWIVKPNKKKGVTINSLEEAIINKGIDLEYLDTSVIFEDLDDNVYGLKVLYDLFFSHSYPDGDALFFTPFANTKKNNKGLFIPNNELKNFLYEKHTHYYEYGLDVTSYDLFFYLYNTKEFFGLEQCSQPYKIIL